VAKVGAERAERAEAELALLIFASTAVKLALGWSIAAAL
jgi:hypothetical protein